MADPNRELLEQAVLLLEPLLDDIVLVGGCATGLLITDSAAGGIRPTKDIDVIVEVASYAEYVGRLSDRLRAIGFTEDRRHGAPLCRWTHQDLIVDVMPTDERILGFSNRWLHPRHACTAQIMTIAGLRARVVGPAQFVATKLEAFHGRGQGDVAASHDLEDIITVIDGRPELAAEIEDADPGVRSYIVASDVRQLLDDRVFLDSLSGFLLPDQASQARWVRSRTRAERPRATVEKMHRRPGDRSGWDGTQPRLYSHEKPEVHFSGLGARGRLRIRRASRKGQRPGRRARCVAAASYRSTATLNPPIAIRLTSNGMSFGSIIAAMRLSVITFLLTPSRCARDL